jgi:hypothetical protein
MVRWHLPGLKRPLNSFLVPASWKVGRTPSSLSLKIPALPQPHPPDARDRSSVAQDSAQKYSRLPRKRRIVAIPTPERLAKSSCRTLVAKRNSLKRLAIASSCSTGVSSRSSLEINLDFLNQLCDFTNDF